METVDTALFSKWQSKGGTYTYHLSPIAPDSWQHIPQDTPTPLQQYWAYGKAMAGLGSNARQLKVLKDDTPVALALVMKQRFAGVIRFATLTRGPLWLSPNTPDVEKIEVLKGIKYFFSPWRWNFMVVQPEMPASEGPRALMRAAGYRHIMTGFHTIWADLSPEPEVLRKNLLGKWRNQLKKAEAATLQINIGGHKPHHYAWLLERETEQRAKRNYLAVPTGLVPLYATTAEKSVLSVTALNGREKVAGALFLLHGNSATYHIGWVGEEGRALNAQNRVLFEAMLALKTSGIRFLDMGGLNTAEQAGIARFKLGIGGTPTSLTGAWV